MAEIVYLLCGITSLGCACLLLRAYLRRPMNLILWSGLCFVGLTINNILLFIDLIIIPHGMDLSIIRSTVSLGAALVLLYGLIWDT